MDFDAGLIPADIVAALGLEWGPTYRLQNIGTGGTLFVRTATAAPAVTDRAFRVESGSYFELRPQAGASAFALVPTWLWTDDRRGVAVIVALAP